MSFLILALNLLALPQPAAQNAFRAQPGCLPIVRQVAGDRVAAERGRGSRLGDEPPAQLLLAVERRMNGCPEATIIRRDIGQGNR